MAAQRAFNNRLATARWRHAAYGSININWKKMNPDLDRDDLRAERLAWISYFLGIPTVESITQLNDTQLGLVAGEMKRLVGIPSSKFQVPSQKPKAKDQKPTAGSVVAFPATAASAAAADSDPGEVSFASSHEQVYTLEKLEAYLRWPAEDMAAFLRKRFKCSSFAMLRFKQATSCTHQLLMIAAHRDLKQRHGKDKPVSRAAIAKYIPLLKAELGIDQSRGK
jgi:hypothetical protein